MATETSAKSVTIPFFRVGEPAIPEVGEVVMAVVAALKAREAQK